MKTLELNTNLLGIDSLNTYSGLLQTDNILHEDLIEQDYNEGYINFTPEQYFENFNHSKYMKELTKNLDSHLSNILLNNINEVLEQNVIESFSFTDFICPMYYNYSTDKFICELNVTDNIIDVLLEFIKVNESKFSLWLKANHSSYDGYISFVETGLTGFIDEIKSFDNVHIGVLFSFILQEFMSDELKDFFTYGVYEMELYYTEFMDLTEIENVENN